MSKSNVSSLSLLTTISINGHMNKINYTDYNWKLHTNTKEVQTTLMINFFVSH